MKALDEAMSLHQAGHHDAAREKCVKVLQRDPGNGQALALHGTVCALLGRRDEALVSFSRFADRDPKHVLCRYMLGNLYREAGDLARAIQSYRIAVKYDPNFADALNNLGLALVEQGEVIAAIENFQRCTRVKPDHGLAHYNLGNALQRLGQLEEALVSYERAAILLPHDANIYFNCGNAWLALGLPEQALQQYQHVEKLAPHHSSALLNQAVALRRMGLTQRSLSLLQRFLSDEPDHMPALLTLANVQQDLAQAEAAVISLSRAAQLAPDNSEVAFNLGNTLIDTRQVQQAAAYFERCVALQPDDLSYWAALAGTYARLWQSSNLSRGWQRVLELWPTGQSVAIDLLMEHSDDPGMHAEGATRLAGQIETRNKLRPLPSVEVQNLPARIRIGYLSPDFGNHPVSQSLVEVLERTNRHRIELIGLSLVRHPDSDIRTRVMNACDQFIELGQLSIPEAVQSIRSLELDILIDLAGHTTSAKPVLLSARLARVQAGYLGFPGTLGAAWLDYLIADRYVVPEHLEKYYSEQVVRLPGCFFPTDTTIDLSGIHVSREQEGLPERVAVFCNFAPAKRITAAMMRTWLEILIAVPDSVLWLQQQDAGVRQSMQHFASEFGIDSQRLVFARFVDDRNEHMARHRLADLYLDTFPYNAHSTGRDALYAGLPLLTLSGASYPSRVAGSFLKAINLPELITHELADYRQRAIDLLNDRQQLTQLRKRLNTESVRAGLFNSPRLALQLEQIYVHMLQEHSARSAVPAIDPTYAHLSRATGHGQSQSTVKGAV